MRILILRHGMTEANEKHLYCGHSDPCLSEGGRRQLLVRRERVAYPKIEGMLRITSGMNRTNETLRLLFGCEADVQDAAFREMHFGRFEMHSYEELKDDTDYQRWICDTAGTEPTPGGESAAEFQRRVLEAFTGLEGDALIVCHGGVIAAIMVHLFPQEGRNMYQWQPGFGLGYLLERINDSWRYREIWEE